MGRRVLRKTRYVNAVLADQETAGVTFTYETGSGPFEAMGLQVVNPWDHAAGS